MNSKKGVSAAEIVAPGILVLLGMTMFVDVLLLVQPLYMLQVYDRVLVSSSVETLVYISLLAGGVLVAMFAVDAMRSLLAGRVAARLNVRLGAQALKASLDGPRAASGDVQPLRDLAVVRGFVGNRSILAFLDLPFAPIFLGVLYLLHPDLFWLTLGGAAFLVVVALLNQAAIAKAGHATETGSAAAMMAAQAFAQGGQTIKAMGMIDGVVRSWGRHEVASMRVMDRVGRVNSVFAGLSKAVRIALQIAILGYGSYLVIQGRMSAGMIFASSLISGKALQPIDQVVAGWKGFAEARRAWGRLSDIVSKRDAAPGRIEMPEPKGDLVAEDLLVYAPNAKPGSDPVLRRLSFRIAAGQRIAVVGPSGAGKSTLAKALVGALPARSGCVRLDGAEIGHWRPEQLGRTVGYLSQDVDLLPGTIAENISRFDVVARDADIVRAARKANVHELVLSLPDGYATVVGHMGIQLSGGQRQRIGLARAFFGSPRLVVLDEPNANLDVEGDAALEAALDLARDEGTTVVVVTQRRNLVDKADRMIVLRDGIIERTGTPRELAASARKVGAGAEPPAAQPAARPRPFAASPSVSPALDMIVSQEPQR